MTVAGVKGSKTAAAQIASEMKLKFYDNYSGKQGCHVLNMMSMTA